MGETRAALRRMRIYVIIIIVIAIWGAAGPHRDGVAMQLLRDLLTMGHRQ